MANMVLPKMGKSRDLSFVLRGKADGVAAGVITDWFFNADKWKSISIDEVSTGSSDWWCRICGQNLGGLSASEYKYPVGNVLATLRGTGKFILPRGYKTYSLYLYSNNVNTGIKCTLSER